MDIKTKIGLWICRGIALIFAVLEFRGCWRHLSEPWADHAQFHSLTGLSYYLGLTILFFMITGKPFQNREWWAWWTLLIMGFFVHGAQLVVDGITNGLRGGGTSQGSGMMFFYLTIAALLLYIIGALLALPHFKREQ
ncbi:hypothetical protein IH992_16600 [Candidatus Poribacteria bacterium]|nr:hypothetical protein [Candidatus Poribacteria bacterium]